VCDFCNCLERYATFRRPAAGNRELEKFFDILLAKLQLPLGIFYVTKRWMRKGGILHGCGCIGINQ